jgi:hypothetical protein
MAPVYVTIPAHGKIFMIKKTLKNATAIYGGIDFNNYLRNQRSLQKKSLFDRSFGQYISVSHDSGSQLRLP